MVDPIPFKRPIRWDKLRSDEAERIVHERAKVTENVIFSNHALNERIPERSILQSDVYGILRNGFLEGTPIKISETEWEVIITKRILGTREAGVVTVIFKNNEFLFIKTVEWMDL